MATPTKSEFDSEKHDRYAKAAMLLVKTLQSVAKDIDCGRDGYWGGWGTWGDFARIALKAHEKGVLKLLVAVGDVLVNEAPRPPKRRRLR
jgi:hypothetical protein